MRKLVIFSIVCIAVVALVINARFSFSANGWTERTNSGQRQWVSIAGSDDLQKLAAIDTGGSVYTSADNGATWTAQAGAGTANWSWISSSADGSKLLLSRYFGNTFLSTDYGVTWNAVLPQRNWYTNTMNPDGTVLAAAIYGSYIYTSVDGGENWDQQMGSGQHSWISIAMSEDGSDMVAADQGGYIYTSTDSGVTWTQQTGSGQKLWNAVGSSADGMKLVAVDQDSSIYISDDAGVTWQEKTNSGHHNWYNVTETPDGSTLFAAGHGEYLYVSTDRGETWTQQTETGNKAWNDTALSSDGSKFAAIATGANIFTYALDTTAPEISSIEVATTTETTAVITWETDEAATSTLEYGTDSSYGTATSSDIATTSHSYTLTGLTAATTYHFKITVADDAGNIEESDDETFITISSPVPEEGEHESGRRKESGRSGDSTGMTNAQATVSPSGETSQEPATEPIVSQPTSASPEDVAQSEAVIKGVVRDLTSGSRGESVRLLQHYLNTHGFVVSAEGGGSLGFETDYFGNLTQAALARFQAANGIYPAVGYFGPITRAYILSH